MSFFYSAHKELNGLYWALGATCWAQRLLGLLLLWPFLFCACSTPVCLIEIYVSLKCSTFWLTVIALWEIEFDPKCGGRAGGERAHAEKWSVSGGGSVQRLTRYMGSKLVSGGDRVGCEKGHYGFSLTVWTELPVGIYGHPDTFSVTVGRLMTCNPKRRCISKRFSLFRCNCFSLKTSSFGVVDELLWSTISTSLSNGPAFNSSHCLAFIVGGSYYKRP